MLDRIACRKATAGTAMAAAIGFTAVWADTALAPPGLGGGAPDCESGCLASKSCPDGQGGVTTSFFCAQSTSGGSFCCALGKCVNGNPVVTAFFVRDPEDCVWPSP